jgi:hypothetical protein
VRETLEGWAALGVTTLIVGLGPLPFAIADPDTLEMVASVVL